MKKRIIGIDVARALAVIGMIIVNFKVVFGENGDSILKPFANFFYGKAAAIFVVLAGVGLALMTNTAVKTQNAEKLQRARKRIFKRAIFLLILGFTYIFIWPADILHYYGVYMLIVLLFINSDNTRLLLLTTIVILLFPMLLSYFDYNEGWIFETFTYTDMWSLNGFTRNLYFNGFHPVIPWVAFMLFGLWYGRQDLNNDYFLKRSFWMGLGIFLIIQIMSLSITFIAGDDAVLAENLKLLIGTDPMPPMPVYMLNGISISVVIISLCILLAKRYEDNIIVVALNRTGQLALTFYVAHVVIGMLAIAIIDPEGFGYYSINFSVLYALSFGLGCVLFAYIWLKYKKSGPLEWIMRKLTD